MKTVLLRKWDRFTDKLAAALVTAWKYRRSVAYAAVLAAIFGGLYAFVRWFALCEYAGEAWTKWMYPVSVSVGCTAIVALMLWFWVGLSDVLAKKLDPDRRRLGYIRIGEDGKPYLDGGERK